MNYKDELKIIEDYEAKQKEYFKPKPGFYNVKFLSELEPTTPYIRPDNTEVPQFKAHVEVSIIGQNEEKKRHIWTISRGKTHASLYGQLIEIAVKQGKLKGLVIHVSVKYDGNKNEYFLSLKDN